MSTLSDLKKQRLALARRISEISLMTTDEDQKGLLSHDLNDQMAELDDEILTIEQQAQEQKESKKKKK